MQSLWEDSHAARGIIGCAAYAAEPGSEAFYVVGNDVLRTFRLCSDRTVAPEIDIVALGTSGNSEERPMVPVRVGSSKCIDGRFASWPLVDPYSRIFTCYEWLPIG